MKNIFPISDFSESDPVIFNKKKWVAVVPMAGKGSRLDFDKPKALFPILGKSILYWLVSTLEKTCEKIVLVVSPDGKPFIQEELKKLSKDHLVEIVVQPTPKGMADAVLCARGKVGTDYIAVVWGDQVTLKSRTLSICQSLLEKKRAALSLPTFQKKNPYICFDRNANGKLLRVRQKREGEIEETIGENDCGVFCFDKKTLFEILEEKRSLGTETKEYNLLPLLPFFDDNQNVMVTLTLDKEDETLGVNTREDAKKAERILSER